MTNTEQDANNTSSENTDQSASASSWWYLVIPAAVILLLFIAGAFGYFLKESPIPAPDSADVGFARDMSEHHRQAVSMSKLLYDRSEDERMRILAYDILTTQQTQIGIMSGWLDAWGYPWNSTDPKMEWMGMSVAGLMPGMATREELGQLRDAQGVEADALFMQLMIDHHRAGVDMAEAAAEKAQMAVVRNLAQGMANAQQSEIEYMQELLQQKGYEQVPDDGSTMNMDS